MQKKYDHHESIYRTCGDIDNTGLLGCGFMKKPMIKNDSTCQKTMHYSLILVLRGNGVYVDEEKNKEYKISEGHIFQRLVGSPHSLIIDPESNWLECFVALDSLTAQRMNDFGIINFSTPCFFYDSAFTLIENFWDLKTELKKTASISLYTAYKKAEKILSNIFHTYNTKESSQLPDFIKNGCKILESNLNSRLTIPEIVEQIPVSYETFRKTFIKTMKISPANYRIRCRINTACGMLKSPKNSVKKIAYLLGYPSPYAFSAQFKNYMGITPSEFAKEK
jgi:AraC-like DNA-binding protein